MRALWRCLLPCLLLVQGLAGAQQMVSGTTVALAAPDLVPVYSLAIVRRQKLVFDAPLEPETEVRVLIIPPGADAGSLAEAPYGRIGPSGDDIYVQFDGAKQAVSLRKWLAEEYGIELIFAPSGD